jgi:hypothetical protein
MTQEQFQTIYARIQYGNATVLDYVFALMYLDVNINVPENRVHKLKVLKLFMLNARYSFYAAEEKDYNVLSDLERDMIKSIVSGVDVDSFIACNRK